MDFSKAFDKVSHARLVKKLDYYGVRGETNTWIENFLGNRKQSVVVEGEKSAYISVLSGVPQGSVLGPCLFLFYINDIQDGLHSTVRLCRRYNLLHGDQVPQDSNTIQADFDNLAEWEQKWKMEFHPDKCEVINITHKRNII